MTVPETHEIVALRALAWIASDEERLHHFMAATGVQPDHLAGGMQDIDFLVSVLDFLLLDDGWISDFSVASDTDPKDLARARFALGGGPPDELP